MYAYSIFAYLTSLLVPVENVPDLFRTLPDFSSALQYYLNGQGSYCIAKLIVPNGYPHSC